MLDDRSNLKQFGQEDRPISAQMIRPQVYVKNVWNFGQEGIKTFGIYFRNCLQTKKNPYQNFFFDVKLQTLRSKTFLYRTFAERYDN